MDTIFPIRFVTLDVWRNKVFVSYDHSEDVLYKRLLQASDANPDFDFEFDSRGPDVAIESTNATTIKQSLVRMMKEATHLLVIVGIQERDKQMDELRNCSSEGGRCEIEVGCNQTREVELDPPSLLGVGVAWATRFEKDRIVAALKQATNSCLMITRGYFEKRFGHRTPKSSKPTSESLGNLANPRVESAVGSSCIPYAHGSHAALPDYFCSMSSVRLVCPLRRVFFAYDHVTQLLLP